MYLPFVAIILGLALLVWSADRFVEGSASVARHFGMPSLLIGMVIVGFGAAAYSPAKYGIVTELVPAKKLVVANGWLEALTVMSIIFGTVLGGFLSSQDLHEWLLGHVPHWTLSPALTGVVFVCLVYALAAVLNSALVS